MTTTELEQVIRDYIRDIYKKEYIGKIKIEALDSTGYCVKLGMDTPEQPITIYAELDDEAFLKFIKKELRSRNFHLVEYGELNKLYPYDCGPRNTKCGCNDRKRIN